MQDHTIKNAQYDLGRITGSQESEQPFRRVEYNGESCEEGDDQELHGREREHIDGRLTEPVGDARRGAVDSGLESLQMALDGKEIGRDMQNEIDDSNAWAEKVRGADRSSGNRDVPKVVSRRMLRK